MNVINGLADQLIKKYDIKKLSHLNAALGSKTAASCAEVLERLFNIAVAAHDKKNYPEALELFLFLADDPGRASAITEIVLESYYKPFTGHFEEKFRGNVSILNAYEHFAEKIQTGFGGLKYRFLPCLKTLKIANPFYCVFDERASKFVIKKYQFRLTVQTPPDAASLTDKIIVANGIFDLNFIGALIEKGDFKPLLWEKRPFYLFYHDRDFFISHLQICNFSDIFKIQDRSSLRTVFVFGQTRLNDILLDPQSVSPGVFFSAPGNRNNELEACIGKAAMQKEGLARRSLKELNDHYSALKPEKIIEKIDGKKLKIGFMTSRFTTALQYYVRDCISACEKLGLETCLLIEDNDISRCTNSAVIEFLNRHRPDIIFVPDHLRFEYPFLPANLVFVCWVVDFMPNIFSSESAKKIGKLDFLLNIFTSDPAFAALGYPQKQLIDGAIMCDASLYRHYELSEPEKNRYSADICLISNSGNIEEGFANFNNYFSKSPDFLKRTERLLRNAADHIYQEVYNERDSFFEIDKIRGLFSVQFAKERIQINEAMMNEVVSTFKTMVVSSIYKTVPLIWLHEKGYDLKIWGKSWVNHPVLKKYAMGPAQNGEMLSKVLNVSKISLGLNMDVTLHPRVMESFLSGSFYIGNAIPAGNDYCNIRKYLNEGEDILFFHGRDDLYEKIRHYLENENDRNAVIARAQKKIKKHLTYEALMSEMVEKIKLKLSEISFSA